MITEQVTRITTSGKFNKQMIDEKYNSMEDFLKSASTNINKINEQIKARFFILENTSKMTNAELLSKLHLIKLFIYYILRDNQKVSKSHLSKIDPTCVSEGFAEIEKEGYVNENFDNIKKFFRPMTICEDDLHFLRDNQTISTQDVQQNKRIINEEYIKSPRGCLLYGPPGK